MVITDMIIVGRLGSNELAAVGLAGDLFWMLLLIGMGVIAMVGVMAAQSHGANDPQGVRDAGEQGLIAATITSVPIMLLVWLLGPLLSLAAQDAQVVELANAYSRALTLSVFPALWFVALRNYVTALARSAVVGWIMVAALAVNLLLNYTLVFGKLGMPALGVVGAGLGTTIVNWGMFLALARHVQRSPTIANYRPAIVPRRLNQPMLREMFRLGIPNAMTQLLNGAMFSVAAVVVGMISAATLAAQQIVYTVIYLALSAAAALADAVRVRVAYGIGKKDVPAARKSAHIALILAATTTLTAALSLWIFPELLVGFFLDTKDPENATVLALSVSLSVYGGMFLLLDGTLMVTANALKGLRDTRSPFWISLIGYWAVGLCSGVWLCFPMGYGANGLWWGLVVGVLLCNVLMYLRFKQRIGEAALVNQGA